MAEPGVVNPLSHFLVYMVTINYGHKPEDSELASRQESPLHHQGRLLACELAVE